MRSCAALPSPRWGEGTACRARKSAIMGEGALWPEVAKTICCSCQPALVELAALHDGCEMLALVLQEPEVLQRIPVDHDQIGEGAGLEGAKLALLPQNPGGDGGG